jgi:hypothetical protein
MRSGSRGTPRPSRCIMLSVAAAAGSPRRHGLFVKLHGAVDILTHRADAEIVVVAQPGQRGGLAGFGGAFVQAHCLAVFARGLRDGGQMEQRAARLGQDARGLGAIGACLCQGPEDRALRVLRDGFFGRGRARRPRGSGRARPDRRRDGRPPPRRRCALPLRPPTLPLLPRRAAAASSSASRAASSSANRAASSSANRAASSSANRAASSSAASRGLLFGGNARRLLPQPRAPLPPRRAGLPRPHPHRAHPPRLHPRAAPLPPGAVRSRADSAAIAACASRAASASLVRRSSSRCGIAGLIGGLCGVPGGTRRPPGPRPPAPGAPQARVPARPARARPVSPEPRTGQGRSHNMAITSVRRNPIRNTVNSFERSWN